MARSLTNNIMLSIYWFGTTGWTLLVLAVLLKPNSHGSIHDYSLTTFVHSFFNFEFKTYNYFEAAGHVLLFGVLAALWYQSLSKHVTQLQALRLTIIIVLLIAFGTELGQFFVSRGSLLFDLIANFLGISLTVIWITRKNIQRIVYHD